MAGSKQVQRIRLHSDHPRRGHLVFVTPHETSFGPYRYRRVLNTSATVQHCIMTIRAQARTPRGEVALVQRTSGVLELRVNGVFVMDTEQTSSERRLAQVALDVVDDPSRVLVGGLGLGFTTAELLTDSRVTNLTVVEIEAALVDWMRDGTIPHGPDLLSDPRVNVQIGDILTFLTTQPAAGYDILLLDVDNGPDQLVHLGNGALYDRTGLSVARRVVRPGGAILVWSAHPAPRLEQELRLTVGTVRTLRVPVQLGQREETYWVYAAAR